MLLIGALIFAALFLSTKTVRAAWPAESFLALGLMGAACVTLFQLGRLA